MVVVVGALHEFPRGTRERRAADLRQRVREASDEGGLTAQDRNYLNRLYLAPMPMD